PLQVRVGRDPVVAFVEAPVRDRLVERTGGPSRASPALPVCRIGGNLPADDPVRRAGRGLRRRRGNPLTHREGAEARRFPPCPAARRGGFGAAVPLRAFRTRAAGSRAGGGRRGVEGGRTGCGGDARP